MRRKMAIYTGWVMKFCGILLLISGCGGKSDKARAKPNTFVEFRVTGIDGNGEAESSLKRLFLNTPGVVDCSIDYLAGEVEIKYDSTLVSSEKLKSLLLKAEEGRFKLLEEKKYNTDSLQSPPRQSPPAPPTDISDDIDIYDSHG